MRKERQRRKGDIVDMQKNIFLPVRENVDLHIVGEWRERKKVLPTVLLVPGFHSDLHEWGYFDEIASSLVGVGFAVYRFSFSGSGLSRGEVYNITLTRQVEELRKVVEFVGSQRGVDRESLGVLAMSFGVVTSIAVLPLPSIASLVFTSGAYAPLRSIPNLFRENDGIYEPEGDSWFEQDYDKVRIGPQFWKDLKRYDLKMLIKKQSQPVLMLYGKDDTILWKWAEEVFDSANEPKRFIVREGAGHDFEHPHRKWLIKKVVGWFKETLD